MSLLLDNFFAPVTLAPTFDSFGGFGYQPAAPRHHRRYHRRYLDPWFDMPSPSDMLEELYQTVKHIDQQFQHLEDNADVEMTDSDDRAESEPSSSAAPLSSTPTEATTSTSTPTTTDAPESANSESDVKMSDAGEEQNVEYVDLTKVDDCRAPACAAVSTQDALLQQQMAVDGDDKKNTDDNGNNSNDKTDTTNTNSNTDSTPSTATTTTSTELESLSASKDTAVAEPKNNNMPSLLALHRSVKFSSDDKNLIITADFAGIPKENIKVEYNNGYLTIKAENKVEKWNKKKGQYLAQSQFFSRSFHVGRNVDPSTIKATYNDGNFQVTVPKPRSAPAVQTITIH